MLMKLCLPSINLSLVNLIIYYRFIVRFPIGMDYHFITFFLHFFLPWTYSVSISSSAPIYIPYISSSSPHHMSIPSQPNTSNDRCDRLNSNQPSQYFTCPSVFMETPHIHLIICISALSNFTQHQLTRSWSHFHKSCYLWHNWNTLDSKTEFIVLDLYRQSKIWVVCQFI